MLTEKQDEIAWQTFCKVDGQQEKRVYAAVEAVLAALPAAQPFSVTLREWEKMHLAVADDDNLSSLQALNTELSRRPAAQPFSVTLEEAQEIRLQYHENTLCDTTTESYDLWEAINTVLDRR